MRRVLVIFLSVFAAVSSTFAASDRTLYALTINGKILEVDPHTAAVAELSTLDIAILSPYVGFDFSRDGRLHFGQYTLGLYRVDPDTGETTFVASNPPQDFIFENMAFAPRAVPGPDHRVPAGTLFTSAFGNLYTYNVHTEQLRFVGWTGHDDDGFAMSPDGTLYAIDAFLALYKIDTATAQSTLISTAPPCHVALAWRPDGQLYCTDPVTLWRLDPQNGAATRIGSTGHTSSGSPLNDRPSRNVCTCPPKVRQISSITRVTS